jgi:hypothetical protein
MKATLASHEGLQQALDDAVVLVLDAADRDFQTIIGHYGVPVNSVPMVYMVGPDDRLFYAQSGALGAEEIRRLLASTREVNGRPVPAETLAGLETGLEEIRAAAKRGDLLEALCLATPVAETQKAVPSVATARNYRDQILTAMEAWLGELDARLAGGEKTHEAAYHVAKMYAHTPVRYTSLRQNAWDLLQFYEQRAETRIAIQQAKHLVRARAAESSQQCAAAIQNYRRAEQLDPESPAGKYATARIPVLQKRQATRLSGTF